jgi:hypothetical protein
MKVLGVTPSNPWCLKNIGISEGFVYSCVDFLIGDEINEGLGYFVEDGFINFHESFDFTSTILSSGKKPDFSYQRTTFKNENELCLLLAYNRSSEDEILIIQKNDPLLKKIEDYIGENTGKYNIWLFGYLFNYFYNDLINSDFLRIWSPQNIIGTGWCTYVMTGNSDLLSDVENRIYDYPDMPKVQLGFSYKTEIEFFDVIKDGNLEWIG